MPGTVQELGIIDDFQHVSITCRDLERSVRFYEALGLEVIKRIGEVEEEGIAHAFQLPRGHLAVVYLAAPKARCSSTWCNGWNLRPRVSPILL
jgi:catechol 2,3-dioxygenase-like lactoylglutathione lyase family enzyme